MIASVKNRIKSTLLDFKNSIQVAHRLDYPKPLYLCDNVRLGACSKEPQTGKWIESFDKGDVVYDIGANVGPYSLIMALYAGTVYAIEPAFMNFYLLNKNVEYNLGKGTIPNNVVPLNVALSDKTQLGTFHYINTHLGKAGNQLNVTVDGYDKPFTPEYSQGVLTYSLDDLVRTFKLKMPNHVKMDVDGIELLILDGAKETMGGPQMKSVLIELDDDDAHEVRTTTEFMEKAGLFLERKDLIDHTRFYNYIFRRRQK